MRIALVTENFLPKIDGVTRTLSMILQHVRLRGHQAIVLGPAGAPRRYAGAGVFGAPGMPIPFYPELRFLLPPPTFAQYLERFQPDIVHVADPMLLGTAGIIWARRLGIPVVSTYHTNLAAYCAYFHLQALERPTWAYRRHVHNACGITLCPSRSTADALATRGFERLAVWPRGVDAVSFSPERRSEAWRAAVACNPVSPIVLYVGRLSAEKNLAALVAAFRALPANAARLVLVGDGPARAEVERALAGHPVTFTGYLRGAALAEAYASADVFAFPSLTETFGQVVMEAMASALPVVAFDAEGVRDHVRPNETGLLAAPGDKTGFASALRQIVCAPPDVRQRLGRVGRHAALQNSWPAVLDLLLDYYEAFGRHRRTAVAA